MRKVMALIGMVTGLLLGQVWIASDAQAQLSVTFHSGATGTADGTVLDASLFNTIGVQVSGTFVGTVSFEGRMEDASTWGPIRCINTADGSVVNAITTTGIMQCPNPGVHDFRARVSSYTSGTIIVHGLGTTKAASAGLGGMVGGPATSIQSGVAFPSSPVDGEFFFIKDDSAHGACDSAEGSAGTLCRWNQGTMEWEAINFTVEADTLATVTSRGNSSTGNDENNPFEILGAGGQNDKGWSIDRTTAGESRMRCKEAAGLNKCDYYRQIDDTFEGGFKDKDGTKRLTISGTTGAMTNTSYDTEGTGNTFTFKRYKWIPGAGCNNATPGTVWDLPTSNAAVPACRTGTNTTKGVLEFADGSSLTAQYSEYLNEDWTGAIDATIIYEANSTSTNNVVWQLAIACAGDGESDDPAFTDDVFTGDAGKTTAHQYNATAANTITTTGTCAAGEMMHIRLKRDSAHASDNLAATAKFVGLSLKLREAQ